MPEDDVRLFVGDVSGPEDYTGFFEDDGETGYLYVSDQRSKQIAKHLLIYDDAQAINPRPEDVTVVWSRDGSKCGVKIFNEMRGIIDIRNDIEGRAKMTDRDSPPINDPDWLQGF